ncbi:hypothetical protein BJ912DRAFT_541389 [Pholiota molesta]|nr:hypothetical protein BJ912DRAFT_541389 [Pholiota molesta]
MPGRTRNKRQEVKREIDSGHPVIILLGETGAGKSTFISIAGPDLTAQPEIGHSLISCTSTVQEYQVGIPYAPGKYVRFVDTPGFNDSDCNGDGEKLSKIIEWLKKEPQTKIIGIIFLHGIDQDRLVRDSTVVSPKDIPTPPGVLL